MDSQQLQDMLEKMASIGVMLPAIALVAGLVLLTLGSKLARPMCAFSGLILGGVAGLIVGEALADQGAVVLALVVGAGIAGALLSALLFRVWMAISGALIFGLAAAGAVLLWQGPTPETDTEPKTTTDTITTEEPDASSGMEIKISTDQLIDAGKQAMESITGSLGETESQSESADASLTINEETARQIGSVILEALRGAAKYYWQAVADWWSEAGTGARGGMLLVGLVAAGIGLLLGLLGPYKAASIQSAVAGAVLIVFSSFSLLAQLMPDRADWLPATPRGVLICLGLITTIGVALQWTIFARETDK
ncbi:MAG: hypothetical protein Kow00105_06660 [Phycisphaeraceae bacterium]